MISDELKNKLSNLPDVYEGFVTCASVSIAAYGIEDSVLELLDSNDEATTEDVLYLVAACNNFKQIPIVDD